MNRNPEFHSPDLKVFARIYVIYEGIVILNMKKQLYIGLACLTCWWASTANGLASEVYKPTRISDPPKIDGVLNEPMWSTAYEVTGLTMIAPDTGEPESLKTFFKFAYTDKALYVGVVCEQPIDTQVRRLGARDNTTIQRDAIRVMLDPSGKGNYGYLFDVGLGGTLTDGTIRPEKEMNNDWDGPWRGVTSFDQDHWYAEIELPWDMMQFIHQEGKRTIAVLLRRFILSTGEFFAVPHLPMVSSVYLSAFAPMEVENINPRGRLTFYPYVSIGYDSVAEKNKEKMGADVFWQPSPGLLASTTFNPDYGDVESDDVVVNLSAIETLFEEKRSFFVEGNDIFKTKSIDNNGLNLVHTRRIGNTPDSPELSNNARVVKSPVRSDIIAAIKMTGQVNKWRYGLMSAFEDDNDFLISDPVDPAKGDYEITVDGRDFYAARVLYEFSDYKLGYLGTFAQKVECDAWVHSIDGLWLSENKQWRFENQAATSIVDDEQGYAWNGRLTYGQIRKYELNLQLDYIDDQFDCNDLGYLDRNDRFGFKMEYSDFDVPIDSLQDIRWFAFIDGKANEHLLSMNIGGQVMMNLYNLTHINAVVKYIPKTWDDITARYFNGDDLDAHPYRKKAGFHMDFMLSTNPTKPIRPEFQITAYSEDNGGITKRVRAVVKFSPLDEWQNAIDLNYYDKEDWIVWRMANQKLVGFDAKELKIKIDSSFQIAQNQELRVGIQWLGLDAEGKTVYDIGADGDLIGNSENAADRSFNRTKFVAQIRYKYEFAPLSDLFLVYNRGGNLSYLNDNYLSDDFGNLLSDSLNKKDVDLIMVKVRYRF